MVFGKADQSLQKGVRKSAQQTENNAFLKGVGFDMGYKNSSQSNSFSPAKRCYDKIASKTKEVAAMKNQQQTNSLIGIDRSAAEIIFSRLYRCSL